MNKYVLQLLLIIAGINANAQTNWVIVDSLYQPLPTSMKVYKSTTPLNQKPFIAYAVVVNLQDKTLDFTADTSYKRRLTPSQFFQKNQQPLVVVNTSFFSFTTHQNLNIVVKGGKLCAFQVHSIPGKSKDTLTWRHPIGSALGISKSKKADVAWVFTDSTAKYPVAIQTPIDPLKDSAAVFSASSFKKLLQERQVKSKTWKMQTAVGGGPVLVQNGKISVANNQEMKFAGKAIDDKHPRTAMGYTADGKLIILAIEGRHPGIAEGATLTETAQLLIELGCVEGLNLDGGGSTCLLVNGKNTITPSDKEGERAVPGIFMVQKKN